MLRTSSDPNFLLLGFSANKDYSAGIVDLKHNKFSIGLKGWAADVWNGEFAYERNDGQVTIHDTVGNTRKLDLELPDGEIGSVQTASVAADLSWIAYSDKSRGGVWNLQTGARVYHLRGFYGGYFTPGLFHAQVTDNEKTSQMIAHFHLTGDDVSSTELSRNEVFEQHGPVLLGAAQNGKSEADSPDIGIRARLRSIRSLEARDVLSQKVFWTQMFSKRVDDLFVHSASDSIVFLSASKEGPVLDFRQLTTGAEIAGITVKTNRNSYQGSFYLNDAVLAGDYLVVSDNQHRVTIYTKTGQEAARVFGDDPVVAFVSGTLAVTSEHHEITLYDLSSGQKRQTLRLPAQQIYYAFDSTGKKLLVLTADQSVYVFEVGISSGGEHKAAGN
jgi:hypothetical protein